MINRREILEAGAFASILALIGIPAEAREALRMGETQAFSFDDLVRQAEAIAKAPYAAPPPLPQDILNAIDYAAHGQIKFKADDALFADGPGQFPVTFFHLGRYFQNPVRMHVVAGQTSREIEYDPSYFTMPEDSPARKLPQNSGFAGFRYQESRLGDQAKLNWKQNDWVAFLGACYFRAIGDMYQYGLSARGIAIDVAAPGKAEEFPSFTNFYFATPENDSDTVLLYALLEGPSLAGAYKFAMTRNKAVIMDVEQALFLRKDVERFGIAPATSMYWYSETRKPEGIDWRPEIHDSDGLSMWTGSGERIWRPLNNPREITASAFSDTNPRGFGLLQRDHNFDHYLDGVRYDLRPSLWVEPLEEWGAGSVQLVEIPTDDEIHDNIVAMWVPAEPVKAGAQFRLKYKLYWQADEPFPTELARCVATRLGNGGQPGTARPDGVRKFMVEFSGGPLKDLPFGVLPEPVLWASRGTFSYVFTEAVPNGEAGHWRAQFDLAASGSEPVEMRLYLKVGDRVMSETWLYQYRPFPRVRGA